MCRREIRPIILKRCVSGEIHLDVAIMPKAIKATIKTNTKIRTKFYKGFLKVLGYLLIRTLNKLCSVPESFWYANNWSLWYTSKRLQQKVTLSSIWLRLFCFQITHVYCYTDTLAHNDIWTRCNIRLNYSCRKQENTNQNDGAFELLGSVLRYREATFIILWQFLNYMSERVINWDISFMPCLANNLYD